MSGTVGYAQGGSYPAAADRAIGAAGMWRKLASAADTTYDGVIYANGADNLGPASSGGWTVTVEPGSAMVAGYRATFPAATVLTHDAATSSARRDLIVVRVRDQESGDGEDSAKLEILKGTTTADPTIPSRCLVVGQINIRASASSIVAGDVVERRKFTAAAGGVVVTPSAGSSPPGMPPGALVYDYNSGQHFRTIPGGGLVPLSLPVALGAGHAMLAGPSPTVQTGPKLVGGQVVLVTNGGGDCNVSTGFTTSLFACGVQPADVAGPLTVTLNSTAMTPGFLPFRVFGSTGAPVASSLVRVAWWAIGW